MELPTNKNIISNKVCNWLVVSNKMSLLLLLFFFFNKYKNTLPSRPLNFSKAYTLF